MRKLTPPFGKYAAEEAALNGSLRHSHSRLSEFSEEIAFLGGEEVEKIWKQRFTGVTVLSFLVGIPALLLLHLNDLSLCAEPISIAIGLHCHHCL